MTYQEKKQYLENRGYEFYQIVDEKHLDEYIENERYCELIDQLSKRKLKKIISTWKGSSNLGRNFVYWVQDRVRDYLKEAVCGYQGVYGDRMDYLRNGLDKCQLI